MSRVEIIAWVDSSYMHMPYILGQRIQSPDNIKDLKFDMVFIAVMDGRARQEIKSKLIQMGISEEQIF